MISEIFDHRGDVIKTIHHDPAEPDKFMISGHQDAEPYLDQNARCRADSMHHGTFRLSGAIPFEMMEFLLKQRGLTWHKFHTTMDKKARGEWFKQILQDRDYYKLSTSESRGSLNRGIIIR